MLVMLTDGVLEACRNMGDIEELFKKNAAGTFRFAPARSCRYHHGCYSGKQQ